MINNSPCFNCVARSPGCHDTCNNYISWKEQKEEEENGQIRKQRYNEYLFHVKHIERSIKSER